MAYRIYIIEGTNLKKYSEDLVLVDTDSPINLTSYKYNFSLDEDGNLYVNRDTEGYVAKYDGDCNLLVSQKYDISASKIRGIALNKEGFFFVVRSYSTYQVFRAPVTDLWFTYSWESISLTAGGAYYGIIFDNVDKDIFYIYNYNGCKIEKWNWLTETKLGERALPIALRPIESISIVDNKIIMPTKNPGSTDPNYYEVPKDLSSYTEKYLPTLAGEDHSRIAYILGSIEGVGEDQFLVFYVNLFDNEDVGLGKRLIKMASDGSILANIPITNGGEVLSKPVLNTANLPTVIMEGIPWEGDYPIPEANITDTGMSECYKRGFEWYEDGIPETVYDWKEDARNTSPARELWGIGEYSHTITEGISQGKKYWIRATAWNTLGKAVSEYKPFPVPIPGNVKAVKSAGHLYLYGNIPDLEGHVVVERGFEYLVQDNEPGGEDTGTEVKETDEGGFGAGEYNLSSWDTFNDLYRAEENEIWWFRAYCLDDGENKYKAETWMKNVPIMTTFECTEVYAQEAKGNGELVDIGANIVTLRGFRIIKEYKGDLSGAKTYRADGFEGELDMEKEYDNEGKLTGFTWTGDLHRDSLHEDTEGYGLGIYDKILGGGFLGEGFGLYLKSNDHYKVVAIAENQLGMGFGEEVDLNTGKLILPSLDTTREKTITLGTLPGGTTVTRIGIRLGRTMGCNEIHVYEDGEWGSGQSVTFFITELIPGASYYKMPYIVINYGDYEEEVLAIPDYRNPERLEEWLEDYPIEVFPEVEDEDELDQIIIDSSVGDISYRTIIKEIKCEKIGEQSFIDRYGRRRSQTVDNHLIQSRVNCEIIVDDYIDKFQILKQKYALEYDIPIPFEREDVILLGDGKTKYKDDGQGLIAFKADGEGEVLQEDFILAKIRKIDGRFISGKEAILDLELEV